MSDRDYFTLTRKSQLTAWISGQMLRGAGLAAAAVVGFGIVFAVLYTIGTYLPAESRDTPDPNTWDTEDRGEP
jgi:Intrinsic membrane protein PufX